MKRIALMGTCLVAMAAGVSAQTALVKDAKATLGGVKDYAGYKAAVEQMKPAFTNPETAHLAETFFIPGEAGFKVYDNYLVQAQLGQNVDHQDMGNALLDGYNFFLQAYPLDSVPDAKGKIKPKYSKKMADMIAGHINDFDNAAVGFWQAHDYGKAYDAWDICLAISSNPAYAKTVKAYPDTVESQIRYNQALAAWQGEHYDKAIKAFDEALKYGNKDPQAYEYAYSVAYQAKDSVHMAKFAEEGLKRFGTEDPKFLQWTVNGYIDQKNYDGARQLLENAIQADPDNSAYYLSYGILNESTGNRKEAQANYKKALELDHQLFMANVNLGRMLAEDYDALDQETGNMSQAEYNKYAAETLNPLLRESAKYFEAAYAIDNENRTPLQYLKNIYYRLNDAENLKRVENLLKY